jgi:hypothetical protein
MSKQPVKTVENVSFLPAKLLKLDKPDYSLDFIHEDKLEVLEDGVRRAEKVVSVCWYIQAVAVFRIFNDLLFQQSGLTKKKYMTQSGKRLHMDRRRMSEAYQAGGFLLKNQAKLVEAGWRPEGQQRKVAYADRALRRHKDADKVIQHLIKDSKDQFEVFALGPRRDDDGDMTARKGVELRRNSLYIDDKEAIGVNPDLPEKDKNLLWGLVKEIGRALQVGYLPEVLLCYDVEEARHMQNLLRKERQKR